MADQLGRAQQHGVPLPRDQRADMNRFYTFCRLADDIADSPDHPPEEKAALLEAWRQADAAAQRPPLPLLDGA